MSKSLTHELLLVAIITVTINVVTSFHSQKIWRSPRLSRHIYDKEEHSEQHTQHLGDHFCYEGCPLDAHNWHKRWPDCSGKNQSPINIDLRNPRNFLYETSDGLSYNFNKNNNADSVTVVNNGHSLQINLNKENTWELNEKHLDGPYVAVQFHFHWGTNTHTGSEHLLDGTRYPVEMHIVHYKKEYGDIRNALNHHDGLAVVGKLFEISYSNTLSPLNDILHTLFDGNTHKLRKPHSLLEIKKHIDLSLLLEDFQSYFMYPGSLTTPPCTESVAWIVDTQVSLIDEGIVQSMVQMFDHHNNRMYFNSRPVQPVNNRTIALKSIN